MADILTNLLTAGAAGGTGFLDERQRREQMRIDAAKQAMQDAALQSEMQNRSNSQAEDIRYHDLQNTNDQNTYGAKYGDKVVPGGLEKYQIDAISGRNEEARQFLLSHPEFRSATSRMSVRDMTPPADATGPNAGIKPIDIVNSKLKAIDIAMGGNQGFIPPSPMERAARFDSLAGAYGLNNVLRDTLQTPTSTVGGVNKPPAPAKGLAPPAKKTGKAESGSLQQKIMAEINAATEDSATLLKEFNADVKANPAAFKGVDLNAVRAAIKAKGNKNPMMRAH